VPGSPHAIDLRTHGHGLSLALTLAPAGWGFFEVLLGLIALGCDAGKLLAQVTVVVAALLGFGLPLVAAMFDFGKLAHRARSLPRPHGDSAWGEGG
jgi:cytochrome c biogenesis protein CcdA